MQATAERWQGWKGWVWRLSLHAEAFVFFKFAENACGVVQVVLNGSISNAFNKNRYFFLYILFARVSVASY